MIFYTFLIHFSQETSFFKDVNSKDSFSKKGNVFSFKNLVFNSELLECDLNNGEVVYQTNNLKCNGASGQSNTEFLIKSSQNNNNKITINPSGEEVKVHLQSLTISISCPVEVKGSGIVRIYLSGTNSFTSTGGHPGFACNEQTVSIIIDKEEGSDDYSGALIVKGAGHNPGLGSTQGSGCKSIQINGGYIEVTGGKDDTTKTWSQSKNEYQYHLSGPGIGTTTGGPGGNVEEIVIRGGIVIATGGDSDGAAIGTGSYGYVGKIDILGGTVIAYGSLYGAAIGAGAGRGEGASCIGNISISSPAVVKAYAPDNNQASGAGIGGGAGGCKSSSQVNQIEINGGKILAYHKEGLAAAIGGGYGYKIEDAALVKFLYIRGGTIVVYGAPKSHGIGCGEGDSDNLDTNAINSGRVYTMKIYSLDRLYAEGRARYVLGQGETANNRKVGSSDNLYPTGFGDKIECMDTQRVCWYPDKTNPFTPTGPDPLIDSTSICNISKGDVIRNEW